MSGPTRPTPPPLPTADQVPSELLGLKRWVGWQAVWDSSRKKWKKPPRSPVTGECIGANTPKEGKTDWSSHWLTFDEARAGAIKHKLDGIGFVFVAADGYVGIDFDNCVKDGVIDPVVLSWLQWFTGAYVEFSPSRAGIHIIGRGAIAKAVSATPLSKTSEATWEIYCTDRFFTVTGLAVRA
jgi:primase-polymerase (primpol)-like protein